MRELFLRHRSEDPMNRKLLGGVAVLIVAIAVVLFVRHRREPARSAPPPVAGGRSAKIDLKIPTTTPTQREWARDLDPEGPQRLEDHVFDDSGGREFTLTATAGDRVGGPVTYRLTEKSDPVVIRVGAGAKVAVVVTGDDSQPIESATVKLADFGDRTA